MSPLDEFEFWTSFGGEALMYHIRCKQDAPEDFDYLAQAVAWAEEHLKECDK